jgi:hypothetical protein
MLNLNISTIPLDTQTLLADHFLVAVEAVQQGPWSLFVTGTVYANLANTIIDRLDKAVPPSAVRQRESLSLNILVRKILQLMSYRARESVEQ